MNGPQHYTEAEELLASIEYKGTPEQVLAVATAAQAHATLALVAAQVDAADLDLWDDAGIDRETEWGEAVRKS